MARGALAALPLVLALSLAGCGGDEDGGGIASAGGGKAGSKAKAAASLSPQDRGLKFAECMRKNGVPMEDPVDGKIKVQVKPGQGVSKETMDKATQACREYSPQADQDPQRAQAMSERAQRHAECMRKNGVEKFPDPDPNQPGLIRIRGDVAEDPDLETAQKTCQDILGGGPGGPGGGPRGGAPGGDGK
ncbi:hypothetical protein [Actinomadura sp. NBRC 104412]|uniref:hypothetical protein n=1 Tax=Actinomadura sp. NBRC 104412 TaxID=3032203 RepID=UPI002555D819|nr:hypothetical protein [Actinomadura sp. NBRC 104412]